MAVGYQLVTSDIVLGTSGTPVAIYGMNILSSGGGAGVVKLRSGTAVGGTIIIQEVGTTSQGVSKNYGGNGIVFPSGCFVDVDANVVSVAVEFKTVS